MATTDTTVRLLNELESIDRREDEILASLLQRLEALEQHELRARSVSVADLQALQTALDDIRAKVAKAQAAAVAPPAIKTDGDDAPAAVAPPTFERLEAQIRHQDASAKQLRELIADRLRALAPAAAEHEHEHEHGHDPDPGHRPVRPKTFRLDRPLIQGPEVLAFQRLLNRRFARWGVNRHIAEHGRYGPQTREAAHQVALGLGLLSSDLERGITPQVRIAIRTPSRRTERQQARASGRAQYRAALRRKYAGRPASNGTARAAVVVGSLAAAIRKHGGTYEDVIVREAKRFGVPVAVVCAVIDVESGFTNVFGHDNVRNPIKSPPRPAPDRVVTEALYREYKRHRKLGEGSQGVGPMQLTFFTLQDEADALGGCFDPAINIRVGVKHLRGLIDAHGLRDGVQRYNGAPGHRYADLVLKRRALWEQRLAGASPSPGADARPGPPHKPGHASSGRRMPPTYVVRRPAMQGPGVTRLQRDINQRFARWGIAGHISEDGVYGRETERAAHQVAIALGINASAYADGVTPRLRVVIRTPSRRTAAELRRARDRREYRAKLRKRFGTARPALAVAAGSAPGGSAARSYPLATRGRLNGVPFSGTHTIGNWQSDNAVDISIAVGTAMLAIEGGSVVKLTPHAQDGSRFAGDAITIRGDSGNAYFYKHGVASVKVGQRVERGQKIGTSGSANGSPHLHLGVQNGDPRTIIGQRS